ncbi:hypothetical protein J3459_012560 [Metarhizium acridum]|nr:hypothetical protein J3459_012560 [Metarhizium acridum]
MPSSWEKELSIAQSAGPLVRDRSLQADSSPVTIADFAAQALLISILHAEFPDDKFVGEEDSAVLRRDENLRDKVYELYSAARGDGSATSVDEMLALIDMGGPRDGRCAGTVLGHGPGGRDGHVSSRGSSTPFRWRCSRTGGRCWRRWCTPTSSSRGAGSARGSVDGVGLGVMLSAARGRGARVTWLASFDGPYETERLPRLAASDRGNLHVVDCDKNRASHRRVMRRVCEELGAAFPGTDVWSSHVRYAALVIGGGDFLVRIPSGRDARSVRLGPCGRAVDLQGGRGQDHRSGRTRGGLFEGAGI